MKRTRFVASIVIATSATLALAACDPPMPPEVLAVEAEKTYTCVEGNIVVSTPTNMYDVVWGWSDSLSYSCVDPEPAMTFEASTDTSVSVDAELSAYPSKCEAKQTVPVAVDAGVLVFNLPEVGTLNVSPKNLAGILDGSVTNWSELAGDNPGYEVPNLPITVLAEADAVALKAVVDFLELAGSAPDSALLVEGAENPNIDQYGLLEYGQVAIVPYSYAVTLGLYPASIFLGLDEEEQPLVAVPDLEGIQSGASQFAMSKSDSGITVKVDPEITPSAASGFEAASPYQAVYPVNYYTCNSETLVPRAVGRFILRLDQQGALGGYNFAPLAENVRIESLFSISKGLPTPKPTPTE